MNIGQPQGTDEDKQIIQASDTKFLRMKYFILNLGTIHRKFNADNSTGDYTDSSLVYEGIEFRFRFSFDRGLINKYVQKGFKCAYATAIRNNESMNMTITFQHREGGASQGGQAYIYSQDYRDPSVGKRMTIESSDTDLLITVKPAYYIGQTDGTSNKKASLRMVEIEARLPSIILGYPDLPEIRNINDIFSRKQDESVITFSIFSTGNDYKNQNGYFTLPVYDVASTGNAGDELEITVSGHGGSPNLFTSETETNDYLGGCGRYIGDPRTGLNHVKELPVPFPVNSRSHHNYSGSENGIKYISTGPSSKVSEEIPNKKSPGIVSLFNKLIKKDKKYE